MTKVPFMKYHGAGNDFVLIDLCHFAPCRDAPALARFVCDRRHGVGSDGLLLLLPSNTADYQMRIFNADGSEPSMCGNGIRCCASYILKYKSSLSELAIETRHAILKCKKLGDEIVVNLGLPEILHWPIQLEETALFVVNTGVPHAVIFVDDLDEIAVGKWGRQIRSHPCFAPHGVNVNFVSVSEEGKVALRTYERGVEAETLACGTGAAAAAFVAMKVKHLVPPIPILTRSSFASPKVSYHQQIRFFFPGKDKGGCAIEMVGNAKEVFEGSIDLTKFAY
jgi:diaminopimelate epimerase